jgi:type III restriction enzyme
MAIYLEQLPHQEEAISSVLAAMSGCREVSSEEWAVSSNIFANPEIQLKKESLHNAVIDKTTLTTNHLSLPTAIDVKMETGTGKTYVYTRLMYELYKKHVNLLKISGLYHQVIAHKTSRRKHLAAADAAPAFA